MTIRVSFRAIRSDTSLLNKQADEKRALFVCLFILRLLSVLCFKTWQRMKAEILHLSKLPGAMVSFLGERSPNASSHHAPCHYLDNSASSLYTDNRLKPNLAAFR